jgi:hypothetical protein
VLNLVWAKLRNIKKAFTFIVSLSQDLNKMLKITPLRQNFKLMKDAGHQVLIWTLFHVRLR